MKTLHSIILAALIAGTLVFASEPSTPDEFIAAFGTALKEKSSDKLDALTYIAGMSETDKAQAKRVNQMLFTDEQIDSISLQPLPEDYETVHGMRGKKIEPAYPPAGVVETKYSATRNGVVSTSSPYAVIDGKYFLVPSKTTDLGWSGPADKTMTFMVIGNGQDKVQIRAKWNASGVDQERGFKSPSSSFMGQHFDRITVTSANDDTDVTLTVLEGGKEVFVSGSLKGKGTLDYKK